MTKFLLPLTLLAIAGVLLAVLGAGCARGPEVPGFPENATNAYEAYLDEPNANTYLRFIHTNRDVQRGRETPNDAIGILVQVRALEVQSLHAKSNGDLNLAVGVVDRVGEIEEGNVIDVYDEVLPGAKARLLAARARVAAMVE